MISNTALGVARDQRGEFVHLAERELSVDRAALATRDAEGFAAHCRGA